MGPITTQAREALRRRGLWVGVWPDRLAGASRDLIDFVNRFHRVAGFEYVVQDYFAGPHRRATARLAVRFARNIAARRSDYARRISFERAIGLGPGGHPVLGLELAREGRRYRFTPWSHLHPAAIHGQLQRDMALSAGPGQVRWVLDGRRLGMGKQEVVRQLRRVVGQDGYGARRHPGYQRWLNGLDEMVLVV